MNMNLLDGFTINNHQPRHQHKLTEEHEYHPPLPAVDRVTIAGDKTQLLVRSAYVNALSYPHPKQSALTGLKLQRGNIFLAAGVDITRSYAVRSQILVGNMGGSIAASMILHTGDTADDDVLYGMPHVSFQYDFWDKHGMPQIDGAELQVSTHPPYYRAHHKHEGGDQAMILRFVELNGKRRRINMVVRLYGLKSNQNIRAEGIRQFDPNNGSLHVTNHVGPVNRYLTADPVSAHTTHARDFKFTFDPFADTFRFKLTRAKFLQLLDEAEPFFGEDVTGTIDNWRLGTVTMQHELHSKHYALYAAAYNSLNLRSTL